MLLLPKKILQAAVGVGAVHFASGLLTLAVAFWLGRLLGVDHYGLYVYALSWVTVLSTIAVFGLDVLTTREIAATDGGHESGSADAFMRWSRRAVLQWSVALSLLMLIFLFATREMRSESTQYALLVTVPMIIGLALLRLGQGELRGFGFAVRSQLPSRIFAQATTLVLATIVVFIFRAEGWLALSARLAAIWIAVAITFFWIPRRVPASASWSRTDTSSWYRSARHFMFISIALGAHEQIGLLALGTLSDVSAAGVYDIAFKFAALVSLSLFVITVPLGPVVAKLYKAGDRIELQRLATRSARLAFVAALLVAAGMYLFGTTILGIVGEEFESGYQSLVILSLGHVFNAAMGFVNLLLSMTGYERLSAIGIATGTVLNVLLCIVLVPVYGAEGAAIAATVSVVVWNLMLVGFVWKYLAMDPSSFGFAKVPRDSEAG